MNRATRISIELLAPPLLGALSVFALMFLQEHQLPPKDAVPVTLIVAYLYAGMPSIVYATVMEIVFSKGLSPASWRAFALSSFLGAVAGAVMTTAMFHSPIRLRDFGTLTAIGLLIGAVIWCVIRRSALHAQNTEL